MDAPRKVTPEVLASLPAEVIAFIQWQAEQIRLLTARVTELEAKLGENPGNCSKPPSSTHPHDKPTPTKPKSKRQRGGQPGHDKHERPLIPTEECQFVIPCVPDECRRCGKTLTGTDAEPLRHQVWELPEMRPGMASCITTAPACTGVAGRLQCLVLPVAGFLSSCPKSAKKAKQCNSRKNGTQG